MAALSEAQQTKLYEALAHGDDEHRAWLWEAIECFFADKPVPPPRSDPAEITEYAVVKCGHGKLGVVTHVGKSNYKGIKLQNGEPWQSKEPKLLCNNPEVGQAMVEFWESVDECE